MRITQVLSGRIRTQALISSSAALFVSAAAKEKGMWNPSASPPPAAAEPTRNLRREMLIEELRMALLFMAASVQAFGACAAGDPGPADLAMPAAACTAARIR